MRSLLWSLAVLLLGYATMSADCAAEESGFVTDSIPTDHGPVIVRPLHHATFIVQHGGKTICIDPVGGAEAFTDLPKPDLVLVTHEHYDHFDLPTLEAILADGRETPVVAPKSVAERMPAALRAKAKVESLANGQKTEVDGIAIEAVPAYNTTAGRDKFHPKGRDNGYILTLGGKRIYIAGDTEDTPEMLALKGIDVAFLPMNLPYTLSVQKAAAAIRQFKPKIVYPYHFRSDDGSKANFAELRRLVGKDAGVDIRVGDWYSAP